MHSHSHVHATDGMVETRHPLKMAFSEYLATLPQEKLQRRIGFDAIDGNEKYLPPLVGDRYSLDDLKADDIASFVDAMPWE